MSWRWVSVRISSFCVAGRAPFATTDMTAPTAPDGEVPAGVAAASCGSPPAAATDPARRAADDADAAAPGPPRSEGGAPTGTGAEEAEDADGTQNAEDTKVTVEAEDTKGTKDAEDTTDAEDAEDAAATPAARPASPCAPMAGAADGAAGRPRCAGAEGDDDPAPPAVADGARGRAAPPEGAAAPRVPSPRRLDKAKYLRASPKTSRSPRAGPPPQDAPPPRRPGPAKEEEEDEEDDAFGAFEGPHTEEDEWHPFADDVPAGGAAFHVDDDVRAAAAEEDVPAPSSAAELDGLRRVFDSEYERAVEDQEISWRARYGATRLSFLGSALLMMLYLWMGCLFYRREADWDVPDALLFTVYTVRHDRRGFVVP